MIPPGPPRKGGLFLDDCRCPGWPATVNTSSRRGLPGTSEKFRFLAGAGRDLPIPRSSRSAAACPPRTARESDRATALATCSLTLANACKRSARPNQASRTCLSRLWLPCPPQTATGAGKAKTHLATCSLTRSAAGKNWLKLPAPTPACPACGSPARHRRPGGPGGLSPRRVTGSARAGPGSARRVQGSALPGAGRSPALDDL